MTKTITNKLISIVTTIAMVAAMLVVDPMAVSAAFNPEINYQGKLFDPGTSAPIADGDYDIVFRLYTVASGGTAIWTESRTAANDVTVTDGLFSVMLGDVSSLSGVDFNQSLWLGVTVESDSEMSPRKPLGAVPAAFVADTLDGIDSTGFLRSDESDEVESGNTLTVTGTLDTNGEVSFADADISFDGATTNFTTNGDFSINSNQFSINKTTGETTINNGLVLGASVDLNSETITDFTGSGLVLSSGALTVASLDTSNFASANISQWTNDAGYVTTSDDSVSGGELDGVFSATGILTRTGAATYATVSDNSANWNTAYGWGDHASEGYITGNQTITLSGDASGSGTTAITVSLATDSVSDNEIDYSTVTLGDFTNDTGFVTDLSSFDTDDLSEGVTNLYSQWDNATGGINYATGKVGIGTTSPGYKLDVQGTTFSSGEIIYRSEGDGNGTGGVKLTNYSDNGMIELYGSGGNLDTRISSHHNWPSYFAGNVGIGTTSPVGNLHVQAASALGGTVSTSADEFVLEGVAPGMTLLARAGQSSRIYFGDANNTAVGRIVYNNASDYMQVYTNNAESLRIDSSGNVGIGTTSPDVNLHTYDSGTNAVMAVEQSGGNYGLLNAGSANASFRFNKNFNFTIDETSGITDITPDFKFLEATGTDHHLNLNEGALYINGSSSNVGINTTSPDQKLEVAQSVDSNGLRVSGYDDQSTNYIDMNISSFGRARITTNDELHIQASKLQFQDTGTYNNHVEIYSGGDSNYAGIGTYGSDGFRIKANNIEAIAIDTAGNVGIGTTSPTEKLTVINGDPLFSSTTGSQLLYLNANSSSQASYLRFQQAGTRTADIAFFNSTNASYPNQLRIVNATAGALVLGTNDTERLTIDGTGNVGIGTTSPGAKFHVNTTDSTDLLRLSESGTNRWQVEDDGSAILAFGDYNGSVRIGRGSASGASNAMEISREEFRVEGLRTTFTGSNVGSANQAAYTFDADMNYSGGAGSGEQLALFTGNVQPTGGSTNKALLSFQPTIDADASWTGQVNFLDIQPNIQSIGGGTLNYIRIGSDFVVDGDGNVGIGTTSPDSTLHAHGDGITSSNTGGAAVLRADRTDGKISALVSGTSGSVFAFDETGYFTIGSTSRSTIEGTSFSTTNRLYIEGSSGDVGINTASPNEKLDIRGRIYIGNTTAPGTTTNRLYSVSGDLYWDGTNLTASGASALNDLSDVTLTSVTTGDLLRYNGSNFVNTTLIAGDIPTLDTAKISTGTFADARISQSSVTQHEGALTITESQISDLGTYQTQNDILTDLAGLTQAANTVAYFDTASTAATTSLTAFGRSLIDDSDAATARTTLGVDAAGTDNSTNVTLAGTPDYLTLSGQEITLRQIDLAADITGTLAIANGGTGATTASAARTNLGLGSLATLSSIDNSNWSGIDLSLANGGTGASLVDPNADRIMFWDDSVESTAWLTASTGLSLSGTSLTVRSASETQTGISERATLAETNTGTDDARHITPLKLAGWTGSSNVATVGTVTSGTWQGGAIADAYISSAGNWNTAYGWGDHASEGYITGNQTITLSGDASGSGTTAITVSLATDSVSDNEIDYSTVTLGDFTNDTGFVVSGDNISTLTNDSGYITASSTDTLTNKSGNISQWTNDSGYITDGNTGWNNTYGFITSADDTVSGSELDGVFSTTGILTRTGAGTYATITDNSSNWNTAYGWGNHATQGYVTNLSSFDTDDLSEGSTNLYSQWATSGSNINFTGGNVSIGTTTSTQALTVDGNIDLLSAATIKVVDNASDAFRIATATTGDAYIEINTTDGSEEIAIGLPGSDVFIGASGTAANLVFENGGEYINWGGTSGTSGYGIRDNAGTLEYKNSGGSWAAISSGGGGSSTYLSLTDTPASFTASAIPYVNGAGNALLHSTNLTFDGTSVGIASGGDVSIGNGVSGNNLQISQASLIIADLDNTNYINVIPNYICFTSTCGSSGFGIRNLGGDVQYKDFNGTWTDLNSLGGGGSSTYLSLTDTPGTFVASAIPYTNAAGNAILHSSDFVFDGTELVIGGSAFGELSIQSDFATNVFKMDANTGLLQVGDASVVDGLINVINSIGTQYSNITGGYLNFNSAAGSAGYGLRDNGGTIQYKNSGGSWTAIPSNIWSEGGSGSYIYSTSKPVNIGQSSTPSATLEVNALAGDTTIFAAGSLFEVFEGASVDSYVGFGSNSLYNITDDRLGIGTTNPLRKLDLRGDSRFGALNDRAEFSVVGDLTFDGQADYLVSGNDWAFRYDADEDVGLYFNSSSGRYDFTNTGGGTVFSIGVANGELVSGGNVESGNNFILPSSQYINWGSGSGSTGYGMRDNAGTIEFKDAGGSWASLAGLSDARLKNVTGDLQTSSALDAVRQLQGVRYNWKDVEDYGDQVEIGFIAQDVQKIVPELVRESGDYLSVRYQQVSVLNTEAIKELDIQVTKQTRELVAIKEAQKAAEAKRDVVRLPSGEGNVASAVTAVFETLNVIIKDGFHYFGSLFTETFTVVQKDQQDSIAGTAEVEAGEAEIVVENEHMTETSQVYLTMLGPNPGYYVAEKSDGEFRVVFNEELEDDLEFDYLVVGIHVIEDEAVSDSSHIMENEDGLIQLKPYERNGGDAETETSDYESPAQTGSDNLDESINNPVETEAPLEDVPGQVGDGAEAESQDVSADTVGGSGIIEGNPDSNETETAPDTE